jgi:hypothetical protein
VTDNPYWQSPSGDGPQAGQPSPWATPAPGTPAPAPQPQYGAAPGWTPPPKPGLIPLRPLSFGTILGSSFRVMRRNPGPTFGLSVLLYGFITIVFAAVFGAVLAFSFARVSSAGGQDVDEILAGSVALVALSALVPVGLAVVATGILQGIISLEVSRATLGEKLKTRGLWRLAKGRLGSLIGFTAAISTIAIVFVAIAAFVTFGAFALSGESFTSGSPELVMGGIFGALALSFVIGLAFTVVAAYFGTKLAFVPTIILLERLTMVPAIKRSWQLTKGNFWRTLGTQLLISVIINVASQVISTPIAFIVAITGSLVNPNSDPEAFTVTIIATYGIVGVLTIVVGAIGLVMQSSAYSLIYIDIRMRREGLDLELLRYVEAKQAGATDVPNPYLVHAGETTAAPPAAGSPWA